MFSNITRRWLETSQSGYHISLTDELFHYDTELLDEDNTTTTA